MTKLLRDQAEDDRKEQPVEEGFNQPMSGGGYFEAKNAVNHLVLITKVHSVYHNPDNVYAGKLQPRDEAKVDVVDLDGDGQLRERVIMTHPGLVNRLASGATNILGRIGQIPTDKGNPAFVLNGFEPHDVPRAHQWVQAYQAGQFQAPQGQPENGPQSQPPAQAPAQQPAQAPAPSQAAPGYQGQPQWQQQPQGATGQGQPMAPWQQQNQSTPPPSPGGWGQPAQYDEPPF